MGNTEANGNIMYVYQSNRTCDMRDEVKMKSKESSQTWTLGELLLYFFKFWACHQFDFGTVMKEYNSNMARMMGVNRQRARQKQH